MSLPKLAIVRGPNLNKWDMQFYEPLMDRYDITAFGSQINNFNISEILFPVIQLPPVSPEASCHLQGLERALIYRDFDLICTADFFWIFSLQAVKVKQAMEKTKVIVYSSEIQPFNFEEEPAVAQNKENVRKEADMIIAATERARETFLLEGVPEKKIVVVNRGVDIKRFCANKKDMKKERDSLNIPEKEFVVLFIGRYDRQKGISDLVFAAKKLCMDNDVKNIPFRFLMVGKGPEYEKIRTLIKNLDIDDRFQFIREYPYIEIHHLHNLSDLLVLPSTIIPENTQERFGMVLVEAMATETPVISTYSGAVPEVIGDAGILVPPSNFILLAEAIKGMMINRELREKLSKKGRKRIEERFDSIKIANKLDQVFQRLLLDSVYTRIPESEKRKQSPSPSISSLKKSIKNFRELRNEKRSDKTRELLQDIEKKKEKKNADFLFLAKSYLFLENWSSALKWLIKSNSKGWKSLYYTGICNINLNNIDDGIACLEESSGHAVSPFWKRKILLSLGRAYLRSEQVEKAKDIFEKLAESYPENDEVAFYLGETYWMVGEREKGFMQIDFSLKLNAENRYALGSLLKKAYELKRFDILKKCLRRYLEYHPLDIAILLEFAKVLYYTEEYEESGELLEKIIIFDKDNKEAEKLLKNISLKKAV